NDLKACDINNKYKRMMEEKPNFNKADNSKVIYRRKSFIILSTGKGFIIHNKKYEFESCHCHVNNFSYAKSIIDLSVRKKMPNRPTKRLIESLIRVNRNSKYIEELEKLK
ncbi:hypothetical protein, partial [Romboutsia sp.]|uniref:hypothetical protein n=1 Tax=Romboutsia sp. TaxID=1965302 RepID=UPI002D183746